MSFGFHDALLAIDTLILQLAWFGNVSDGAFLFLRFFCGLDLLKAQKLSNVLGHWFGHSQALRPLMPTNSA